MRKIIARSQFFPPKVHAGHQKYRADIDGLRAVAVGLVVAYHAYPSRLSGTSIFSGGFVGVDVFFVISGFLISSIIFSEISDGKFRFKTFYARRIRRIFPPLIVVLLACLALGAMLLLTGEFRDLAKFVAASAGFVANIALLQDVGYFNTGAETKPLLHIWSLGIEEQFYLIWPVTLYAASKLKFDYFFLLLVIFAGSFAANMAYMNYDVAAAFYLPYTRFFELTIGSGIAYFTTFRSPGVLGRPLHDAATRLFEHPWFCNVLSFAGVALILAANVVLTQDSPFPGWRALVPTAGAALIIAAGAGAWFNRRILAHPFMVFIGVLSYSIYLWHWPLFSFLFISTPEPTRLERVAVVLASVGLSWLSYLLVERPVRFSKRKGTVLALCLTMAGVGLAGVFLNQWQGLNLRGRPDDVKQLSWEDSDPACYKLLNVGAEAGHDAIFCYMSRGTSDDTVAILGDSMANSLYPGFRTIYGNRHMGVINLGVGTCAPFRNLYGSFVWNRDCNTINDKIYAYVVGNPHIRTVVLGFSAWDLKNMSFDASRSPLSLASKFARMEQQVNADIAYLRAHGKYVVVTFDGPNLNVLPRHCIMVGAACDVKKSAVEPPNKPFMDFWNRIFANRSDICIFQQAPLLRTGDFYLLRRDGELAFRDDHHLSYFGSDYVARGFAKSSCFAPTLH